MKLSGSITTPSQQRPWLQAPTIEPRPLVPNLKAGFDSPAVCGVASVGHGIWWDFPMHPIWVTRRHRTPEMVEQHLAKRKSRLEGRVHTEAKADNRRLEGDNITAAASSAQTLMSQRLHEEHRDRSTGTWIGLGAKAAISSDPTMHAAAGGVRLRRRRPFRTSTPAQRKTTGPPMDGEHAGATGNDRPDGRPVTRRNSDKFSASWQRVFVGAPLGNSVEPP
jgi:hypothetical protein